MSSSILNTNSVVLATAMAVSGTIIVLALRLQKSLQTQLISVDCSNHNDPIPLSSSLPRRSCISSDEKKKKKKKKRVHFAEDVMDPSGNSEEFRKKLYRNAKTTTNCGNINNNKVREMPANRMALYNGILRDRIIHRPAYSY